MIIRYVGLLLFLTLLPRMVFNISVDLNQTQASLYTNNKIVLKFMVSNGTPPYKISYLGIPLEWTSINNDLIISNFSLNTLQRWTFDIVIKDGKNTQFFQTIRMILNGYQIQLTPITVGVTKAGVSTFPQTSSGLISPQSSSTASKQQVTSTTNPAFYSNNNNFDIKGLINSYPGINTDPNFGNRNSSFGFNYTTNSFITPEVISNAQANYDPNRDARKITEYEVKRNAAFLRQENAEKIIANIVTIIQRLDKQIQTSKKTIITYETQLKANKDAAFECKLQEYNLQNTRIKISNAISDRNDRINQFKLQINLNTEKSDKLKTQIIDLKSQMVVYSSQIQPQGNELNRYEDLLQKCKGQQSAQYNKIDEKRAQIQRNNIDLNLIQNEVADSNTRYQQVTDSLTIVKNKIQQLKEELKKAEDQQILLAKSQAYYKSVPLQGLQKIKEFQTKNNNIQAEITKIQNAISGNIKQCNSYQDKINKLKKTIADKKEIFKQLNLSSTAKQNELKRLQSLTQLLRQSMSNLPFQIRALQLQLDKYSERMRQQTYLCEVSTEFVERFDNLLQNQKNNLEQYLQSKKDAGVNLQKARIEKELADSALQEIIASSADVLPFSILPNGGSTQLGGAPLGNNPSGSALGPAFRVDADSRGVSTPQSVGNLSNYLSNIYGLNIDPRNLFKNQNPPPRQTPQNQFGFGLGFGTLIPGSGLVTTPSQTMTSKPSQSQPSNAYIAELQNNAVLYPLSPQQKNLITNTGSIGQGLSSFRCVKSQNLQSYEGTLESVSLGSINVRDKLNQQYTLSLSTCTSISSTKKSQFFVPGNRVFFSGEKAFQLFGTILFNAHSILIVPK